MDKADIMAKRWGPGVWEDANGDLHFSIPELLELEGLPDTPENRGKMTAVIKELLRMMPPRRIIERPDPPPACPGN